MDHGRKAVAGENRALTALLAVGFIALVVLGLSRWNTGLVTNYDLGIFSQSAQDYSAGRLPYSDIRQLPLLGDHFSPILALNGLAWLIWPDPRVLVVIQAALIVIAAALIAITARKFAGRRRAIGVAAIFLVGPGVTAAALFDFHETAYAAPLIALLCAALLHRRWWGVVAASVALLLVKEDLGLTIVGAAACWLVMSRWHEWRRAVLLALLGVVGVVVAMFIVAAVNPAGGSDYLGLFGIGEKRHVAGQETGELLDPRRLMPLVTYTVMTAAIGWRSPLTLVALPTLLWRTVSSNPLYWTPEFHYDLLPAVVAALALAHAWGRDEVVPRQDQSRDRPGVRTRGAVLACALVALGMSVTQTIHRLPAGLALHEETRVADIRALGAHVPTDARIAALNNVGAYLVADHTHVHQLQIDHGEPVRFVMFTDDAAWAERFPLASRDGLLRHAKHDASMRVWSQGGVTLVDLGRERSVADIVGE